MGGTLAGITLDLPNSNLSQEAQDKINRDNVKGIQEVMKKSGLNELFNVKDETTATYADGVYSTIPGMQVAIVTSGGFLEIDALIACNSPGGGANAEAQIVIDTIQQDFTSEGNAGGGVTQGIRLKLRYAGFIAPGPHTVTISMKGNGGAVTTNAVRPSRLWGKETIV